MHEIYKLRVAITLCSTLLLSSCGAYFNQPVHTAPARIGEDTEATQSLKQLPIATEPVVVGVYKFRDQTGQYKPTETGSTFSTAVTQGATTILIKALEDSKWFMPIERENLSNLLNERNIIRSTRKEYRKNNSNEPQLPPLLYAGIILEGGIVSYDSNIITGGLGARYFGISSATQYRQDRITVYLRAVSTASGKILKTVYVSKTILSQAVDASFFRFVKLGRLLEAETGFTQNEPGHIAVTAAIEKAVRSLIIEGIEEQLWTSSAPPEEVQEMLVSYKAEKEEASATQLYDRYFKARRGEQAVFGQGGVARIRGDYSDSETNYYLQLGAKHYFNPYVSASISLSKFELSNQQSFSKGFNAAEVDAGLTLLPFEKVTPLFTAGIGSVSSDDFKQTHFKMQYGAGLEYMLSKQIGLQINAKHHLVVSDDLDQVAQGKRDDQYITLAAGVNWYINTPLPMDKQKRKQQRVQRKKVRKIRRKAN